MPDFKREDRYVVLKLSDVRKYLGVDETNALNDIRRAIAGYRHRDGKQALECVVVESDWPEYEPTWAAIEARMTAETK